MYMNLISNLSYIFLSASIAVLSFLFSYTPGLRVAEGNQGPIFVNEYKSSGSGDNVCIIIGCILFSIPILIKMLRITSKINKFELLFLLSMFIIQTFSLLLIELGSIKETITIGSNYFLALWLIMLTLVPFYVFINLSKKT